ncbi:MAG TPA: cupredoxin domain-containing protein [Oscillatoriales cyanobacterium M59_W2019_021]|nr:MAG: biphenyl 2,3-dioxygenase [Cyanobacteria bacterium J055]HIK33187.1 cupredoxin domain-containing protein [Oscillatoriales cyanobacterium M4454_W2019_049]HIK53028.1 cupredoxin domain-containing protein [Oscillatoriales cyanobacterium M59_W2019_021]
MRWFETWRSGLVALTLIFLTAMGALGFVSPAMAAQLSATEVKVSLGNAAGELKFFPNTFEFVAGQTYKLLLENPSPEKHYFTSKDFADASWTRKVEAGNVEVKGDIRELELKPGATAEWMFVPMKPGTYTLRCTIPGHAEAGMTGEIIIK